MTGSGHIGVWVTGSSSGKEMERQDQCGGDRQVPLEHLAARYEDHRPALAKHQIVLACVCGAAEDVDCDAVREALLIRAWTRPQWVKLARGQARLLQQLAAGCLLRRLAGLDTAAGQAPLVRRDGRVTVSVLQQHRTRGVDEQDERDFVAGHREMLPHRTRWGRCLAHR